MIDLRRSRCRCRRRILIGSFLEVMTTAMATKTPQINDFSTIL